MWPQQRAMTAACGYGFTLLVTGNADMLAFGKNSCAQLGTGDVLCSDIPCEIKGDVSFAGERVAMVAAAHQHAACVTEGGGLWTWGNATFGRTGHQLTVVHAQSTRARKKRAKKMRDRIMLPGIDSRVLVQMPRKVHLDGSRASPVVMVACGDYFTVALTASGLVWLSGSRDHLHASSGSVTFKKLDPRSFADPGTGKPNRIAMVASGDTHLMALDTSGLLWMWGDNLHGALGLGVGASGAVPTMLERAIFDGADVVSMDGGMHYTMILTGGGILWACGYGEYGQLGLGNTSDVAIPTVVGGPELYQGRGVRMAACGQRHTLVVTHENQLWSFGIRIYHVLGLGRNTTNRLVPTLVPDYEGFVNANVVMAAAGSTHSVLVVENGRVYTWGQAMQGHDNNPFKPMGLGHHLICGDSDVSSNPRELQHTIKINFGIITPMQTLIGAWHERYWIDKHVKIALAFAMGPRMCLAPDAALSNLPPELTHRILVDAMRFQPTFHAGILALLGVHKRE